MTTGSLFSFNNFGNLKDSDLENVGNGFGYAFSTNDGSDINGIFLSIEVVGYKFQLKADTSISGRIKYRMYHYSNATWSDWVSLT